MWCCDPLAHLWRCSGPRPPPKPLPFPNRRMEEDPFPNLLRWRQLQGGTFPSLRCSELSHLHHHRLVVPSLVPCSLANGRTSDSRICGARREELKGKLMKTRRLCENINESYFQKQTALEVSGAIQPNNRHVFRACLAWGSRFRRVNNYTACRLSEVASFRAAWNWILMQYR